MKTYRGLYESVCSFDNLVRAARRAARGKKDRVEVAGFLFELEREVLRLRAELLAREYRPQPVRRFRIRDPKPRLIGAPCFRDRVVHHAFCQVVGPLLERSFIYDTYACRVGKGTHRALDRFTHYARRFPYVLKLDVQQFFASIDHTILLALVGRRIRDDGVMWLMGTILDSYRSDEGPWDYFPGDDLFTPLERPRGLPLGALTSQLWANAYLGPLDHFVIEEVRVGGYVRYCDDIAVFGRDKPSLRRCRDAMCEYLAGLRLRPHPDKCMIYPVDRGVAFLGFKVFPDHRLLLKGNVRRFRRRMRRLRGEFARGQVPADAITRSVRAWVAHAGHGDTYHLREGLLGELSFSKG